MKSMLQVTSLETKTKRAVELLKDGQTKKALAIFRTFRLGLTQGERRTIQIASEVVSGHAHFYQSIGIDTDLELEKALVILRSKYL